MTSMTENVSSDTLPRPGLSARSYFTLAAAIYLLTTGWNLSSQPISNPEEARYACAARQMLRDGDWIVPKFNGEPRLVKPILFYWLICATGKLGGLVGLGFVTAMRLGPLMMGFLTVCATFLIARKLTGGSSRAAFVAAVVLMTCNEFHKLSRELVVDMTLTAFLLWAWYFVLVALERIEARSRAFFPLLGFYLCLGLACMTKGPLPVAGFVVLPLLVYLILTKRLRALAHAGLWWGAPISLAIGLWWFYVLTKKGHQDGAWAFFLQENYQRILGQKDHIHPWPWIYYFTLWPEGLAPWILALPLMIWAAYKQRSTQWGTETDAAKFIFCAFAIAFFIIGLSASKRTIYLLPLYPHFAIWAGWLVWSTAFRLSRVGTCTGAETPDAGQPKGCTPNIVFAALGFAVVLAMGYEIAIPSFREKGSDFDAFYSAVRTELHGRKLVTLNESANEAVWYLDLDTPIIKLAYPTLKEKFFEANDTVLLLNDRELVKRAELKPALRLIDGFKWERGRETYFLASPDPGRKPDEKLFERRSKDTGKDKDSGED